MSNTQQCLISKDNGKLQIPYADYLALMEKAREGQRIRQTRDAVVANLRSFLGGNTQAEAAVEVEKVVEQVMQEKAPVTAPQPAVEVAPPVAEEARSENVSVEFDAAAQALKTEVPAPEKKAAKSRKMAEGIDVPPIKKDISVHFNKHDESGRLFSVFKQYYTCLNDTCGGTVRVTMKDGFCSLWNYDEWEEFAFVDIYEGHLRIAVDPRYTNQLKSLNLCEVPRLLSSRRNLVCVQVDDLNNTMLDILVMAFKEVGLTAS